MHREPLLIHGHKCDGNKVNSDFLSATQQNLYASAQALATLQTHAHDRDALDALDALDSGVGGIVVEAERRGFQNLKTFAGDLQGFVGLLQDRMTRVQEIIAVLIQGDALLETMVRISAAGLDHANAHSEEVLMQLADAATSENERTCRRRSLPRGARAHA